MRRWIQRLAIALTLTLLFAAGAAWWAVQQTQHVPEFYEQAKRQLPRSTAEASRQLTEEVEELQNRVARLGWWKANFSDEEINAWLIEELPRKFPRLLASGASEPRIMIEDGRLLAAARYRNRRIDTVVSCELEVELTEQPNMLALRIKDLRAGALPLPLSKFRRGISKEAAKGGIDIRWDTTERGPVALVTVPSEHPKYVLSPVVVESVELQEGKLELFGHTGSLARESYRPKGPVYQFVSYQHREKRSDQPSRLSSRRDRRSDRIR